MSQLFVLEGKGKTQRLARQSLLSEQRRLEHRLRLPRALGCYMRRQWHTKTYAERDSGVDPLAFDPANPGDLRFSHAYGLFFFKSPHQFPVEYCDMIDKAERGQRNSLLPSCSEACAQEMCCVGCGVGGRVFVFQNTPSPSEISSIRYPPAVIVNQNKGWINGTIDLYQRMHEGGRSRREEFLSKGLLKDIVIPFTTYMSAYRVEVSYLIPDRFVPEQALTVVQNSRLRLAA